MLLDAPTPEEIAEAASELDLGGGRVLAVLLAEPGGPDPREVVERLRRLDVDFAGGVFPGLIHGGRLHERGALLLSLPAARPPVLVRGLDRPPLELPDLGDVAASPPGSRTALVLVDGLTPDVSGLLGALQARLGDSVRYVGGGAGALGVGQRPCVFTREGLFQDAAVIAFVALRSSLGVRHGWRRLDGPLVATRTRGNVIQELNWQPAFDVYKRVLAPFLDRELTRESFFSFSNAYPFGIYKEVWEDVVRDPVAFGDAGELVCVGDVPENAVLNVLAGDAESLLEAADEAARDCRPEPGARTRAALVCDCASRKLSLGARFERELETVQACVEAAAPGLTVHGMLTLGEVASHGEGFVEFFNKTIVAATLHE